MNDIPGLLWIVFGLCLVLAFVGGATWSAVIGLRIATARRRDEAEAAPVNALNWQAAK